MFNQLTLSLLHKDTFMELQPIYKASFPILFHLFSSLLPSTLTLVHYFTASYKRVCIIMPYCQIDAGIAAVRDPLLSLKISLPGPSEESKISVFSQKTVFSCPRTEISVLERFFKHLQNSQEFMLGDGALCRPKRASSRPKRVFCRPLLCPDMARTLFH